MWWWKNKLAVVVMCADWRLHQKKAGMHAQLCRLLKVQRLDLIAFPGPDGILKPERLTEWPVLQRWVKILIEAHDPSILAVVAHQRCLAHPASAEQHERDVLEVANALKAETGFKRPVAAVVAVWRDDMHWIPEEVGQF